MNDYQFNDLSIFQPEVDPSRSPKVGPLGQERAADLRNLWNGRQGKGLPQETHC